MVEFTIEKEEVEKKVEEKTEIEQEAKPDKVESLAKELGWRPDVDFEGKDFVDAETYIRKSKDIQNTMRGYIKDQKNQLNDMSTSINDLKIHNEQVYKAEVKTLKKELSELQEEKKEAIEDGDVEKVGEIDGKIDGVYVSMSENKPTGSHPPANSAFEVWAGKNKWYKEDPEMATYADVIADQNPGLSFGRVSTFVEGKVKEMFPDKFQKQKLSASPVEGATKKIANAKMTAADLTSNQKNIMSQFVRQGIMTEKQYIEDISKIGG